MNYLSLLSVERNRTSFLLFYNSSRTTVTLIKKSFSTMFLTDFGIPATVRTLNAGGAVLKKCGLVAPDLSSKKLEYLAKKRTGLSNFGDWAFQRPLEKLIKAYEQEANLTMLGRITVHELIVNILINLLLLEEKRRYQPSTETEPITSPVFIIGLPRTGTTLLHGLMEQDAKVRVPQTWEVMFPANCSGSAEESSKTQDRTRNRLNWANRLAPGFKRIHNIAPELPQECIVITAHVFLSTQFHTACNVPSYQDWFEQEPQKLAYEFHYRLLQHLQIKRTPQHWVLKAPGHLFALDALLKRYPDAKIIQTHRNPLQVMPSMASHATVLRRALSNQVNPKEVAHDWAMRWNLALGKFLEVRDRSPSDQFLDVHYDDIEREPLETIYRIYDFLGWTIEDRTSQAMKTFLASNPKNKYGVHRYSLGQYGLNPMKERKRFSAYCERFSISTGKT